MDAAYFVRWQFDSVVLRQMLNLRPDSMLFFVELWMQLRWQGNQALVYVKLIQTVMW